MARVKQNAQIVEAREKVPKVTKRIKKAEKQAQAIIPPVIIPQQANLFALPRVQNNPFIYNRNVVPPVVQPVKNEKLSAKDLKADQWFSSIIYNKVTKVDEYYVHVENQYGVRYMVEKSLTESESHSASQYTEEKRITRTELVDIFENANDTVFTVNFITKPTEEKAKQLLNNLNGNDLNNPAGIRKLAQDIIQGHESTIVGHLTSSEPKMGRSSVIDLNLPRANNVRMVDHRSLNWLIYKNTKFVVK
jgi:hypothetical protein